jgi:hypothetical protein
MAAVQRKRGLTVELIGSWQRAQPAVAIPVKQRVRFVARDWHSSEVLGHQVRRQQTIPVQELLVQVDQLPGLLHLDERFRCPKYPAFFGAQELDCAF